EADAEAAKKEPRNERDHGELRRSGEHQRRRSGQADGQDEKRACERKAVRDHRESQHHQQCDRPERQDMSERWRYTLEPEGSRPEKRRIEGVAVTEPEDRGAREFWISERQNGKGATGPEAEQQRGRQPAARKTPGQASHH